MDIIFKTLDYREFLNKLVEFTSINIHILDNLNKLNLLSSIFKNKHAIYTQDFLYEIYDPELKENYSSLNEYVFASYPLHNTNYKIFDFKNLKNYATFSPVNFKPTLIDHSTYPKSILVFESSNIELYISLTFTRFCKHDLKLLNNEEKKILENNICTKLGHKQYTGIYYFVGINYNFVSHPNHSLKHQFTSDQHSNASFLSNHIKQSITLYKNTAKEIKQKDFPVFEKILISKELTNF